MTFLKKLRDAAAECTKPEYRASLKAAADLVDQWINRLYADPSEANMTALNSAWAMAERVYKNRPSEGDPAPLSGATEAAILAA